MAVAAPSSSETSSGLMPESQTARTPDVFNSPLGIDWKRGILGSDVGNVIGANAVSAFLGGAILIIPEVTSSEAIPRIPAKLAEVRAETKYAAPQGVPSRIADRLYEQFLASRVRNREYDKLGAIISVSKTGQSVDASGYWRELGEQGAEFLIRRVNNEGRPSVREGVVSVLQMLRENAVSAIVEGLTHTATEAQLEVALRSLQDIGLCKSNRFYASVLSRLRDLARSDQLDMRELAYMAAASIEVQDRLQIWKEALSSEEVAEARELLQDLLSEAEWRSSAGTS